MSRRHFTFGCRRCNLVGTLDDAAGTTGLLIVTGGNETRAGAFDGQAELAAEIAATGFPVMRFDRRGVGDSEGENPGFRDSGPDIAAAVKAFRLQAPALTRIVGFGNCDAASALMLTSGEGFDALVLANPWTFDEGDEDAAPPPAAIRSRYAAKLTNPRDVLRLLTGKVSLKKLSRGMGKAVAPTLALSELAKEMQADIEAFDGDIRFLLAGRDRAAQQFEAGWDKTDPRITRCPGATHSFAEPDSKAWLLRQVLSALEQEQAR